MSNFSTLLLQLDCISITFRLHIDIALKMHIYCIRLRLHTIITLRLHFYYITFGLHFDYTTIAMMQLKCNQNAYRL